MPNNPPRVPVLPVLLSASLMAALAFGAPPSPAAFAPASTAAAQFDLSGPVASGAFGTQVAALPNGNIVITDPKFSGGGRTHNGAVYLYNGHTHAQISRLAGNTDDDQVGSGGVFVLPNGDYVVDSPLWNVSVVLTQTGAVTWCSATAGCTGVVSAANSLVGSQAGDQVGSGSVWPLTNSNNYVVLSPNWANGGAAQAGAASWVNGASQVTGVVSVTNSLVGSQTGDQVGLDGVAALSNGNYVVISSGWANDVAAQAGAATWGNGATGITGVVTVTNSLVGSQTGDLVGATFVTPLTNGNYVVASGYWNSDAVPQAGAATWGDGSLGVIGVVSTSNSLVGSQSGDQVGASGVWPLSNGNFVVASPFWKNGGLTQAGAVTWGNGESGITGVVTDSNSLVGSAAGDQVGLNGIRALTSGNYVVFTANWHNGLVSQAGAATWVNGAGPVTGVVTTTNSLVGSQTGDLVGSNVAALSNGNYVVASPHWKKGGLAQAGAATWANGATGITGVVTVSNSLVGSIAGDQVGLSVTPLSNGNYVTRSFNWHNGLVSQAGAATWGNGESGITGVVTVSNSLVGTHPGDQVGSLVTALSNGDYVVKSPHWTNGGMAGAGAVTLESGLGATASQINNTNSVLGGVAAGGISLNSAYDYFNDQLVVGRPAENIVTFYPPPRIDVSGNDLNITSGATTASLTDGTDFGSVTLGQAITHTFTISNSGLGSLALSGAPLVALSGAGAGAFSVVVLPTTPIAANSATTFQVRFSPTVTQTRGVTVTILSSDGDASPFTFALQGAGLPRLLYLPLVMR